MEPSAAITFVRPFGLTGAIRKFRILCDGVEVARIANNGAATVSLAPGRHSVQMKSDWLGAKPLDVTLMPEAHLRLICASPDDIVQSMLATFCLPNAYLQLRELTVSEEPSGARGDSTVLRPSWARVAAYCGVWFVVVAIVSAVLVAYVVNTPGSEQVQTFRIENAGQVAGLLLGGGCSVILLLAFLKRRTGSSRL